MEEKKNDEELNFWDKLKAGFSDDKFEEFFCEPIAWVLLFLLVLFCI